LDGVAPLARFVTPIALTTSCMKMQLKSFHMTPVDVTRRSGAQMRPAAPFRLPPVTNSSVEMNELRALD